MRALSAAALALLLGGIAAAGAAVERGEAHLYLLLIFPVVTGSSALFGLGALGIVAGIVLLFLSLGEDPPTREGSVRGLGARQESAGSGGVVLIGPVPIFFGNWRNPGRRAYWVAVALGCLLLLVALAFFFVVR
ncbi:MAG: DUF131 domain-containing protein [Thermoplasmata archaeon]|nr:DUF131 domain-containing protein [Thermoplasmata archaeon]